jgi:hypothetical protein
MACFLAPTTAAIITNSVKKKVPSKYHINWLLTMLWGGVAMLIVEHIAHGEVVLFPPFLTAMENPADIPAMLKEIATVGTSMTVAIFVVWAIMVCVANTVLKTQLKKFQVATS